MTRADEAEALLRELLVQTYCSHCRKMFKAQAGTPSVKASKRG